MSLSRIEKKKQTGGLLYIKNSKNQVPLKSIFYSIEIIDSLALISLHQNYENRESFAIETEYFMSISSDECFYSFELLYDGKKIKALVKEKENAKKDYQNALIRGKTAAYSDINPELKDVMLINVGNIPSHSVIEVKINFLKRLDISLNKFWKLQIPGTFTPRYRFEFLINQANKQYLEKQKQEALLPYNNYSWDLKITVKSSSEIMFLRSPTHEMEISYDKTKMVSELKFLKKEVPNKDFVLLYSNELINKGFVTLEHLENDQKYPFCAMVSELPDFNPDQSEISYAKYEKDPKDNLFDINILKTKGEFIVLLDRSGSMSGSRIKMAREALIFFLKSLPPDSLFQIYSFGSTYDAIYSKTMECTEKNINWAINKINGFEANYGGTEIFNVLNECFNQPLKNGYPRNVFLITDGDVYDTERIISLIEKNNDLCRTYTVGIGNGSSNHLIMTGAEAGKGKYEFILNLQEMNEKIIYLLQDALSPFFNEIQMEYDKNIVELVSPMPKILRKNETFTVFLFLNKQFEETKKVSLHLSYYDSMKEKIIKKELIVKVDDLMINNDFLHKFSVFTTIRKMQQNFKNKIPTIGDIYIAEKMDLMNFALDISLKYQILSEMTAFICVEDEKEEKKENTLNKTPPKIIIPTYESIDYHESSKDSSRIMLCKASACSQKSSSCCGGGGGSSSYSSSNYNKNNEDHSFEADITHFVSKENEILLKILQKQKHEGFWEYDSEVLGIIKIKIDIVKVLADNLQNKLLTIIILYYLENKMQKSKGAWILIFNKAKEWLRGEGVNYPNDIEKFLGGKKIDEIFAN